MNSVQIKKGERQLTLMEGMALDMMAEGKTPRQIGEALGITAGEAAKMAYNLLDREIMTDAEQRRKLQVYRLEKLIEALWQRVMKHADKDDVKNVIDILDKLNVLLALNKENDAALEARMHAYQMEAYMRVVMHMLNKFMEKAPGLMQPEEWQQFMAETLEEARGTLVLEEIEGGTWQ